MRSLLATHLSEEEDKVSVHVWLEMCFLQVVIKRISQNSQMREVSCNDKSENSGARVYLSGFGSPRSDSPRALNLLTELEHLL